jgi:hypothetical protein
MTDILIRIPYFIHIQDIYHTYFMLERHNKVQHRQREKNATKDGPHYLWFHFHTRKTARKRIKAVG